MKLPLVTYNAMGVDDPTAALYSNYIQRMSNYNS